MSYYLQLRAVQSPFPIGADKNNRELISCNYDTERYGADTLLESDIASLISGALLVSGSKIYLGMKPVLPLPTAAASAGTEPDGPFVRIIASGGYQSDINRSAVRAEKPSCQVIVASLNAQLASQKAQEIYRLLDGKRHITT